MCIFGSFHVCFMKSFAHRLNVAEKICQTFLLSYSRATRNGDPGALAIIGLATGIRANRRSRRSVDDVLRLAALTPRGRWVTTFAQQLWSLWRMLQLFAVPYQPSTGCSFCILSHMQISDGHKSMARM